MHGDLYCVMIAAQVDTFVDCFGLVKRDIRGLPSFVIFSVLLSTVLILPVDDLLLVAWKFLRVFFWSLW